MRYKVITSEGPAEVMDTGTVGLGELLEATDAIACESGVVIPWHAIRRFVPVVESVPCDAKYVHGNSAVSHCRGLLGHEGAHQSRYAGSDTVWT